MQPIQNSQPNWSTKLVHLDWTWSDHDMFTSHLGCYSEHPTTVCLLLSILMQRSQQKFAAILDSMHAHQPMLHRQLPD